MSKKKPTMAERNYLAKVQALNCLICGRPAEIHHLRAGQGMSQRASNYLVVPLCESCHRTGGYGVAIHASQKQFEFTNKTDELSMLAETIRRLNP